jgi:hypothetical protein
MKKLPDIPKSISTKIVLKTNCNLSYKLLCFSNPTGRFPKAGKLQRAVAQLTPEILTPKPYTAGLGNQVLKKWPEAYYFHNG